MFRPLPSRDRIEDFVFSRAINGRHELTLRWCVHASRAASLQACAAL
jgi:hypothetical protein